MKTWRPNHYGSAFSNRVSVHDTNDIKLFVIEHYLNDNSEREDITKTITTAPEMLKVLTNLLKAAKPHAKSGSTLDMRINEAHELLIELSHNADK